MTYNIRMSNELEEFAEIANSVKRAIKKHSNKADNTTPADFNNWIPLDDPITSEDEDPPAGRLCQYSKYGTGFLAATETIKSLDHGVYKILPSQSGIVFEPHAVTTDDLLRLPDSKSDEVISEIESFWKKKELFNKFGFAHKRGFLLYGPPGSGKSSTVAIVISQMIKLNGIVFLGDGSPQLLGSGLKQFREIEPDRPAVVILEDIDALIENYGESDILSILDGENSIDNVCYIASTNYPDSLDPRIINRPSRFDRVVNIGMPSLEARFEYLKSRNLGMDNKDLTNWAEATKDLSIAHLKEIIVGVMCFNNKFENELKRVKDMAKPPKNSNKKAELGFV